MYQLRLATEDDFEGVVTLSKICFKGDEEHLSLDILKHPKTHCIVAEISLYLVGYIVAEHVHDEEGSYSISSLATAPSMRGCGISEDLINYGLKVVKGLGWSFLDCQVRRSHKWKINYYSRHGLRAVEYYPEAYSDGEDAVIMEANLS